MFYLSLIEHTLRVPPDALGRPIAEAIKEEIEKLFLDKVITNLGLCVSVYDIDSVDGGFIFPAEGAATYTVIFRLVMFRPFVGEIITAKIKESNANGLQHHISTLTLDLYTTVSLGFFDDIYVPSDLLPSPSRSEPDPGKKDRVTWIWDYTADSNYIIYFNEEIRFQVQSVNYPPIPLEQQKESKPFAPMVITGSLDSDGLGPISWWIGAEPVDTEES